MPAQDLDLILARWVLGELPPEGVPALATAASYANDAQADRDEEVWEQLAVFVALADDRREGHQVDEEIVAAASALLEAGGLQITDVD